MKNKLSEFDLSFYERRLDALGALLDREIHKILVHMAHEMPMTAKAAENLAERTPTMSRLPSERRFTARVLIDLYLFRLRHKVLPGEEANTPSIYTYAQMLEQALHDTQTLH